MKDWLTLDNALIAGVLAVTVARSGSVVSRWEADGLEWVGYLAAGVMDAIILRFAYLWRKVTRKKERRVRGTVFAFFALWTFGVQVVYMLARSAQWYEAVLLAAPWPVALVALAVNDALLDDAEAPKPAPAAAQSAPGGNGHAHTERDVLELVAHGTMSARKAASILKVSDHTVTRRAKALREVTP